MTKIEQFIPEEYCLKCRGCCRFSEENSAWSPCLLDEEIQQLVDNPDVPAVNLSLNKKIELLPAESGEGFLCPLLLPKENKCRIYLKRPFECQLYPFLLVVRPGKVMLTLDLNCPYVKEHLNSPELQKYIEYLASFLNHPTRRYLLKNNPQLIQAYEEVLEVIELNLSHET